MKEKEERRAKDNAETQSAQRFRREEEKERGWRGVAGIWRGLGACGGLKLGPERRFGGLACCGYAYAEFLEFCAGGAFFFSAWIATYDFA